MAGWWRGLCRRDRLPGLPVHLGNDRTARDISRAHASVVVSTAFSRGGYRADRSAGKSQRRGERDRWHGSVPVTAFSCSATVSRVSRLAERDRPVESLTWENAGIEGTRPMVLFQRSRGQFRDRYRGAWFRSKRPRWPVRT